MPVRSWIRQLFTRPPAPKPSRRAARTRLDLQKLESRDVPASILVTSLADNMTVDGLVTLREAVRAAELDISVDGSTAGSGADTIGFAEGLTGTITLTGDSGDTTGGTSSAFRIDTDVTINGPFDVGQSITLAIGGAPKRHFIMSYTGSLSLSNLTLTGGSTAGYGGSIWSFGTLNVRNSTFTGNTANEGGALQSWGGLGTPNSGEAAALVVENSTFVGNSATLRGGAVYSGAADTRLTNNTITGNTTTTFGAFGQFGTAAIIKNTILSGNTNGGNGSNIQNDVPTNGRLSAASSNNLIDVPVATLLLGPLADNGGPTKTVALQAGSSAVNAGTNTGVSFSDQRGQPRQFGPKVDIGAYESQATDRKAVLNQLVPGGLTGTNPLADPLNTAFDRIAAGDTPAATAAINTASAVALDLVTTAGSGIDLNTFIGLSQQIVGLTDSIGVTVPTSYDNQVTFITNFVTLAVTIPGGLTGTNTLVSNWKDAGYKLITQNIPAAGTALQGFNTAAIGMVTVATSGVDIDTFITLSTAVNNLTDTIGKTQPVPQFVRDIFIADFRALAGAIPGGLTGTNPLVAKWVQAGEALVNQRIPEAVAGLNAYLTTAAGQNLSAATMTTVRAAVGELLAVIGAPTAAVSGPSVGVRGQTLTFTLGANDTTPGDDAAGFTHRINWGDGSAVQVVTGGVSKAVAHTYTGLGNYTVSVTATDQSGLTGAAATKGVAVGVANIQLDADGKRTLYIGGSTGEDRIRVRERHGRNGEIFVKIRETGNCTDDDDDDNDCDNDCDNRSRFAFSRAGVDRVVVLGQSGNDYIRLGDSLEKDAVIFGGDGNDRIQGGGGNNVLVGGNGNDILVGGDGRDLIIGGDGADQLSGRDADDILIAGYTDYDSDLTALRAIHGVWVGTGSNAARVAALTNAAFAFKLTDGTVHDDNDYDVLAGDSGIDWFFYNFDGPGTRDRAVDRNSNEARTDID